AQLDLARTTVYAPSSGVVTNLQLGMGAFVGIGQAAMTYIDIREIWVDPGFRENTLENIKAGDPVDVVLDIRSGRIFKGRMREHQLRRVESGERSLDRASQTAQPEWLDPRPSVDPANDRP